MPETKYTNKSLRDLNLKFFQDEGGIFVVCSKLHMSYTGASNLLSPGIQTLIIYHLKSKIRDFWTPSTNQSKNYDDAVKQLITATLTERGIDIHRRPLSYETPAYRKIVTPDENNSGSHIACLVEIDGNENKRCLYEEGHQYDHMTEAEYDANPGELGEHD